MFTQAREPTLTGARPFEFDGVVFHPTSGTLELDGRSASLRPRTAAVLEYLLQNQGRLIAKDEFLSQVWSDAVVTEDSLTQCIKEIRKALGPAHADVIRTVPRVGYQLAVPVSFGLEPGALVSSEVPDPQPPNARWVNAMGAVLTLVLLIGLMGMGIVRHAQPSGKPPLSILVLPFADIGGSATSTGLGEVLSSELTMRLGQTAGTLVISADTARVFRDTPVDPRSAAKATGVRYVLTGTVRRADQQVWLNLVLTEGESGIQRWAQQVVVGRELVHLTMEDFAQQVARSLNLQMHRWGGEAAARISRSQVQAEDLAMQGWAVYFRGLTPDNLQASTAFFDEAVGKDAGSVRGWGGVAVANGLAAYTHWANDRPAAIRRLHSALNRLYALDADGFYTHVGRSLAALVNADWDAVLAINSAGIARFPGHSPSHYARALALTRLGRFDECLESANTALKIGPRDHQAGAYHLQAAFCHFHLRQYAHAIQRARLAHNLSPRLDLPPLLLAVSSSLAGDRESASRTFAEFRQRRPEFSLAHATRLLSGTNERFVEGRDQFVQTLGQLGMK